jgi:type IV fimbrial biogenesis protein FimT
MKANRSNGFTIIELMIAMVVLAILLAAAAPMFNNLIKNNRMISEAYALRATFNNARSEALARRTDVTVCRSNDGATCTAHTPAGSWSEGYIAFSDDDGDGFNAHHHTGGHSIQQPRLRARFCWHFSGV